MLWTSDDLREEICINCGRSFEHRKRAPNKYCAECGGAARYKKDQNARQVLHRLRSRREFLWLIPSAAISRELESRPVAAWAASERTDKTLAYLEGLLVAEGPNNPSVRSHIREEAALLIETTDTSEHDRLARAWGLLADIGTEADGDTSAQRRHATEAVKHYLAITDRKKQDDMHYARLAGALLRFSNVCRNGGDDRTATRTAREAYDILKEKTNEQEPHVMRLLHQADVRVVRLLSSGNGPALWQTQFHEMIRLDSEINSPEFSLETARELAGYYGMRGLEQEAMQQLAKIKEIEEKTACPVYNKPTTLRPRIEYFLASARMRDKEEGIRLIEEDYVGLYRQHPHAYYARVLETWCKRPEVRRFGLAERLEKLSPRLPSPDYDSSMLMVLPRGY